MGLLEVMLLLAWVALLLALWAIYQLVAQNGRLLLRVEALERHLGDLVGLVPPEPGPPGTIEHAAESRADDDDESPPGLPVGTVLHDFELPDLQGQQHLRSDWLGSWFHLVFVSPYCRHSRALLADLARLPPRSADEPMLLLVSTGSLDENRRLVARTGLEVPMLLQEEMEAGALFEVTATPMAYVVDPDGRTASALVAGRTAILGITASSATHDRSPWPIDTPSAATVEAATTPAPVNGARYSGGLEVGSPAPAFTLCGLDGETIALDRFRGQSVLLVFTDPIGPPFDELAPVLETIHRAPTGPKVVLVARGDSETNRSWVHAHGLTVPIGLQARWDVSRDYGLLAAPIAYLLDSHGVIAAPVAVGADAILDLCQSRAAGNGA